MRLESVQDLKFQLLRDIVEPIARQGTQARTAGARALAMSLDAVGLELDRSWCGIGARPIASVPMIQRSFALGVSPHRNEYRLAVRLQRVALRDTPVVDHLKQQAKGEVDIRVVGRIDKRLNKRAQAPAWYQLNTRPLLIGASVGHFNVTAGTIGAFVNRNGATSILSNNHVLANEGAQLGPSRPLFDVPLPVVRSRMYPSGNIGIVLEDDEIFALHGFAQEGSLEVERIERIQIVAHDPDFWKMRRGRQQVRDEHRSLACRLDHHHLMVHRVPAGTPHAHAGHDRRVRIDELQHVVIGKRLVVFRK